MHNIRPEAACRIDTNFIYIYYLSNIRKGLQEGDYMRKVVSSVLVVFMCLFMFTGCHDDRTLEQKISQAEIDRFVNEQKQTPDYIQTCDDLTLEIKGNEVYMGFRLRYSMNNDEMNQFKKMVDVYGLKNYIEPTKQKFEQYYKVRPDKISIKFYTKGGQLICNVEG